MKLVANCLAVLTGLFFAAAPAGADSKKPNLIVVMVDDMGYEGVSCFGNPYFQTPEIDRLAAEGMRLTDFHSSGTVCSPTRAGLLTGRYQQRAGIEAVIHPVADHPEHRRGLQLSETTFAEALKEAGYVTGLIGKWHQGYPQNSDDYHPQNHGFDEFVGYHSGNIDFVSHIGDHYAHDWWHGKKETKEEGYTTHLINQYALDFVRRHGKSDQPFCLYVAHESIHNPVQVPGDPVRRTLEGWDRWKWRDVSKEERIEKYKGMTLPIDEGIGQLRKALVELGIEKDTLVLFFSDNGPSGDFPSGSPDLRGGKGSVYEGGHKVPAIAWWPGKIEAGTESDVPLISIDVMPTLLGLAGAKSPDRPLDGVDMSGVLLRGEPVEPRPLFWASLSNGGARSEAMRDGPWKLVVQHPEAKPGTFDNEKVELFRLDKDPGEENDLSAEKPEQAAKMLGQLKAWFADTEKTATPQPGGWIPKPKPDADFFNGKDLTGWSAGEMKYWSVEDGAIVGQSEENVPRNEFLWSDGEVTNFYLAVDVKLTPNNRNAGIQFRSKPVNEHGQALGYQADVGAGVWGKLYHEHGRGKLDWNDRGPKAVKPGEWNRYEILAVGHRIWTAINGTLCVAIEDPEGELSGKIAFQIHSGPPQDVRYRVVKLVHDPEIRLEKQTEEQLLQALPQKQKAKPKPKPRPKPAAQAQAQSVPPTTVPDFLRPLARPDSPVAAFADGQFKIDSDQIIAILGGANAAECQRNGWLETRLVSAHPDHRVRIRNLAWPADTVYRQWRPRNFFGFTDPDYGERDGRDPIEADISFVWFGQMESLEGASRLPEFRSAYEAILDSLSTYTRRIVLVTPTPFEDPLGLGFDLKKRNADLARYADAIREIADARKLPVVDLAETLKNREATSDGALLSQGGHESAASAFARELGFTESLPPNADYLREAIREKNALWHRYWVPSNWAFLYGNRQTQPSSRDHTDPTKRWFPEEVKAVLPKVEKLEAEIREKAGTR